MDYISAYNPEPCMDGYACGTDGDACGFPNGIRFFVIFERDYGYQDHGYIQFSITDAGSARFGCVMLPAYLI